jgi:hypothetical protein
VSYLSLNPIIVEADMYGIFRLIPRKSEMCKHVSCGFKDIGYWKNSEWIEVKRVQCTYERYIKCTTQELADPTAKVGTIFACMSVAVIYKANNVAIWEGHPMMFLYDLIGESIKDRWFQNDGNGVISPHSQAVGVPLPSATINIKTVIEGMKAAL